jgi:hypothetical protein
MKDRLICLLSSFMHTMLVHSLCTLSALLRRACYESPINRHKFLEYSTVNSLIWILKNYIKNSLNVNLFTLNRLKRLISYTCNSLSICLDNLMIFPTCSSGNFLCNSGRNKLILSIYAEKVESWQRGQLLC